MTIERIDVEACVGCGICLNTCSMDVIRLDDFIVDKKEIPPCRAACPAGVNIRGYTYLLKHGRLEEAIKLIREALPIPAVTGHVCFHPCEEKCARQEVDEAININALERYVADYWLKEKAEPIPQLYVKKVAIVGSGPAGLAAAYTLAKMGYPVTVFESMPMLGGMLRIGIPEYRLPKDVLDAQINYIKDMGVEFKSDTTIGKDLTLDDLKNRGYEAILFATGAQLSGKLAVDGAQLNGVLWGLDFLRDVNLKHTDKVKDRVVVIGGGDVAVDAALTALRLGAKEVQLVCLESKENMPAHEDSLKQARDEGVHINTSWGPVKVLGDGKQVTGIQLVSCTSVFDEKGKFNPSYDEEKTKSIETNMVIFAIGERADLSLLPEVIRTTDEGTIMTDPVTLATTMPGVFAAGVVVSGPSSVVEAIATGKRASVSIDRYLRNLDLKAAIDTEFEQVKKLPKEGMEKKSRQTMNLLPVEHRSGNFREIKMGFSEEAAMAEAQRCMACGSKASIEYLEDCMTCFTCETDCPEKAIYVSATSIPSRLLTWG